MYARRQRGSLGLTYQLVLQQPQSLSSQQFEPYVSTIFKQCGRWLTWLDIYTHLELIESRNADVSVAVQLQQNGDRK